MSEYSATNHFKLFYGQIYKINVDLLNDFEVVSIESVASKTKQVTETVNKNAKKSTWHAYFYRNNTKASSKETTLFVFVRILRDHLFSMSEFLANGLESVSLDSSGINCMVTYAE